MPFGVQLGSWKYQWKYMCFLSGWTYHHLINQWDKEYTHCYEVQLTEFELRQRLSSSVLDQNFFVGWSNMFCKSPCPTHFQHYCTCDNKQWHLAMVYGSSHVLGVDLLLCNKSFLHILLKCSTTIAVQLLDALALGLWIIIPIFVK